MKILKFLATISPVCLLFAVSASAKPAHSQSTLTLVAARNNVLGSFLGPQAVYANSSYIFGASNEGNLLVLQNRAPKYPLVATIPTSTMPLVSVASDGINIYVTSADSCLYAYGMATPFALVKKTCYSGVPIGSLVVTAGKGGTVIVSEWQGRMAADSRYVYVSELNAGDVAQASSKSTGALGLTFGNVFDPGMVDAFDRTTGAYVGNIPSPLTNQGTLGQVALFADGRILAQTIPGCCGTGISLFDPNTGEVLPSINEPYSNTVATATINKRQILVDGTELGTVVLYDITDCHAPHRLAVANLRQLTGHNGSEDIEIRALYIVGNEIIAVSSWGNATSKGPSLPSVFILTVGK